MRVTKAFPIVISGPSGAGKTTLVDELVKRDSWLKASVSATTRPPREGEAEGDAYFFVSEAEFEALKAENLVEWAEVHGHLYGTPKDFVDKELSGGRDVVLNIDVQGGAKVRKCFPEAALIFILPPSFRELEARVRRRGTDYAAEIKKRMENAREEIKYASAYDYIVVNDQLERTVSTLEAIIRSERCRRQRYPDNYTDRFVEDS